MKDHKHHTKTGTIGLDDAVTQDGSNDTATNDASSSENDADGQASQSHEDANTFGEKGNTIQAAPIF
ncbi:unnamed protein product [Ambrosiozyma monospora]|uniref:Unnamed protein product n=1 Tax=Ambrosiozyma monospora TaxID=43982 RepID=A0ACB5U217_AMBMO|nr:unnamed protein product [Ambrosiozyma monospora]